MENDMSRLAICGLLFIAGLTPLSAHASDCFALAQNHPRIWKANIATQRLNADEVRISFIGHSSFVIESTSGTKIVTDYNGNIGDIVPDAVTMNRAHRTHYTDAPDPRIKHVLRGWGDDGGPARHNIEINDVRVRNVPTDLRGYSGYMKNGNSIFIFEVAGLCIGHLGHLHHPLDPQHIAQIGRLDVVMVPVDGGYTMAHSEMADLLRMLKTRIIIPMHYFSTTNLSRFISTLDSSFKVTYSSDPDLIVSRKILPAEPVFVVLPGN